MRSRHNRQNRRSSFRSFQPDRGRPHPSSLPYLSRRLCPSRRPCPSILRLPSSHLHQSRPLERPRLHRKSRCCRRNRPNICRLRRHPPHPVLRPRRPWSACSPPRESRTKAALPMSGPVPGTRVERSHLVYRKSNYVPSSGACPHFGTRGLTAHFDRATGSYSQPTARPSRGTRLADRACGNGRPALRHRCRGGRRPTRPT